MLYRYDDVTLIDPVLLRMSAGEADNAPAGCRATVLFLVEGSDDEIYANLEVCLADARFGFADVAANKTQFHKTALEKQGESYDH